MQQAAQIGAEQDSRRICIIADDLTGACDSGVAFVRNGRAVRVALEEAPETRCDAQVIAFTTESRHVPASEAAERVSRTVGRARDAGVEMLFRKLDSAGRGHLGAETLAAMRAWSADIALVAPAFPQAGRTVDAGLLHVRDAAGQHSIVPLRPFFAAVEPLEIGILHTGGATELQTQVERAVSDGVRILLCDTATEQDLQQIALAGSETSRRILWAGSAGLARALASALPAVAAPQPITSDRREGGTLVFVGTDHPVTKLQVLQLASAGKHTLHRIAWEEVSEEGIRESFGEAPVSALVLTGGDTAAYVLRALQAHSIRLAGELSPGIPWGILEGGLADGCLVVTKSGGFGPRDALLPIIDFCNGRDV